VDIHFELNGTTFIWNAKKAAANPVKHDGICFEQAVTVFFDPFFRLVDASRNDEARDAVIGYDAIRIISARRQRTRSTNTMISDRIEARLTRDRPMTSITLRIPVDVVDSMKEIAPQRGFSGYQALLKAYIGDGLRRDEAQFAFGPAARLIEILKKRGVPESMLEDAIREVHPA